MTKARRAGSEYAFRALAKGAAGVDFEGDSWMLSRLSVSKTVCGRRARVIYYGEDPPLLMQG